MSTVKIGRGVRQGGGGGGVVVGRAAKTIYFLKNGIPDVAKK